MLTDLPCVLFRVLLRVDHLLLYLVDAPAAAVPHGHQNRVRRRVGERQLQLFVLKVCERERKRRKQQ